MRTANLKTASMALLSIVLLLSGSMMLYRTYNPDQSLTFQSHHLDVQTLGNFPAYFPIKTLVGYSIRRGNAPPFHLKVARYRDEAGNFRQAIVFSPNSQREFLLDAESLRSEVWNEAAQSIREHVDDNALFFSWWDNTQRLHLMAGQDGWAGTPLKEAYTTKDAIHLWSEIGGRFDPDSNKLMHLAKWLMMDANQGLEQVKKVLLPDQTAYFLTSMDDLARLQELSLLAGRPINLRSRVFRSTDNFHNLIIKVKSWAKENGTGSYLVQPVPGVGVRAWSINDKKDENRLFIRLLPFTHSLENPLEDATLVFRSERSGYISIFKLEN